MKLYLDWRTAAAVCFAGLLFWGEIDIGHGTAFCAGLCAGMMVMLAASINRPITIAKWR